MTTEDKHGASDSPISEHVSNPPRAGFLRAFWYALPRNDGRGPFIRWRECLMSMQSVRNLYHYTTMEGLKGIVEENGIWATSVGFLNDTQEWQYGRDIASEIIERLLKKPTRYQRNLQFTSVLQLCQEHLRSGILADVYLASFSELGDSLDQWRAYCADGGVSIELGPNVNRLFQIVPVWGLHRVSYRKEDLRWRVLLYIRRYFQEMQRDLDYHKNNLPSFYVRMYAEHLMRNITYCFTDHKDPAFASEKEIRLVIYEGVHDYFQTLRFRSKGTTIIPYYSTADLNYSTADLIGSKDADGNHSDTTKLPIVSVTISPMLDQERAGLGIRRFLDHHKYGHVKIHRSRIPYRKP